MAFSTPAALENEWSGTWGSGFPLSWSPTIPSLGSNNVCVLMLLVHSVGATFTLGTATWGGTAMTHQEGPTSLPTGVHALLFYLVNGANGGSVTIQVTATSPSSASATIHMIAGYVDADGAITMDDSSFNSGASGSSASVGVTVGAADRPIFSGSAHTANALGSPTTTDCTELHNWDSGGNCSIAAYSISTGSGTPTHIHNYSQSGVWECVGISFQEEAGAIIPLSTVTLASAVQATTLLKGAISVPANTITLAGTIPAATLLKGAISVILNSLTAASSVEPTGILPGSVSVPLLSISIPALVQALTVAIFGEPQSIPLLENVLASAVQASAIIPGGVGIPLNDLFLTSSIDTSNVLPGAVGVSVSELTLLGQPQTLQVVGSGNPQVIPLSEINLSGIIPVLLVVPGGVIINLSSLTLSSVIELASVLPGAISVLMNTLQLSSTPLTINVATDQTIPLNDLIAVSMLLSLTVNTGLVIKGKPYRINMGIGLGL